MANTWNQVGTLMGPQGPRGATGATGAKGGSVRVANIDVKSNSDVAFSALKPADGVQVGDVVIDANGDVYAIASVDSAGSTAHVGEAVEGVSGAPTARPSPSRAPSPTRTPCLQMRRSATPTSRAITATCGSRRRCPATPSGQTSAR